jgi:hypothetical protein
MPIEIRELVIRATVDPGGKAEAGGCQSTSPGSSAKSPSRPHGGGDDDVVQRCVREVLRILEDKRER